MKEEIIEALMDLVHDYIESDDIAPPDLSAIADELAEAGVSMGGFSIQIDKPSSKKAKTAPKSVRVFSAEEQLRLSTECRGFLLSLNESGIITPAIREDIINKVLSDQSRMYRLDELKWLSLKVILQEVAANITLNVMVKDNASDPLHSEHTH
jgi:Smg protein